MKKNLDIGEVIQKSGLPASTLRYYEEKGLIKSIGRNGLRRIFDITVLEQLSLISLGSQAGFSLNEIAEMFSTNGELFINREKLLDKAEEFEQTINHLIIVRDMLIHVANCKAKSHLECPKFNKLIKNVGKKRVKK
ncbi:MAG: helix-turn-helix domain-containing protein [Cyanobacteriota bacterium]|mgnify:CR=1 FL=1